jgi:hypothetical protein
MDMCDRITALYEELDHWCGYGSRNSHQTTSHALQVRQKGQLRRRRSHQDTTLAGLPATWLELSPHSPSPNQMVLNSVTWDTELLISVDGLLTKTTIGKFTDAMERQRNY